MKIDTNEVRRNKLSIDQFLALLKVYNVVNNLDSLDYNSDVPETYGELEQMKLLKVIYKDKIVQYVLRKRGDALIKSVLYNIGIDTSKTPKYEITGKEFDEFWKVFPLSDSHSYYNRTRNLKSNKTGCKTKYNRLLVQGYKHDEILKALNYEIKERKATSGKSNNLKFMKNSYTWLNQKEFEIILETISKEGSETETDWTTNTI